MEITTISKLNENTDYGIHMNSLQIRVSIMKAFLSYVFWMQEICICFMTENFYKSIHVIF